MFWGEDEVLAAVLPSRSPHTHSPMENPGHAFHKCSSPALSPMPRLFCALTAMSVVDVHCHFCLLSPRQRGGLSIAHAGEDACYRRTPYCGGVSPSQPSASFEAGARVPITFQQNLNHWYQPDPGFMDVSIASGRDPDNEAFSVLASIPDFWGMPL